MKKLLQCTIFFTYIVLVSILASTIAYSQSCGDNSATGNEECDRTDLRGYDCTNICRFDISEIRDYESTQKYPGNGMKDGKSPKYYCGDAGVISCKNDCKFNTTQCYSHTCGDGAVTGNEECDSGAANSDTNPNSCRTDCTLPRCGDGIKDNGEQCDNGVQNSDQIPGACRPDCSNPTCGDGVIDFEEGEECDDDSAACFRCRKCIEPKDNLHITADAKLCPGVYQIKDAKEPGIIIVDGNDIKLDCNHASIIGIPSTQDAFAATAAQSSQAAQAINSANPATPQINDNETHELEESESNSESNSKSNNDANLPSQKQGFFKGIGNLVSRIFGKEASTPAVLNLGNIQQIKTGTGIVLAGNNIVLLDCDVARFKTGIDVKGKGNSLVKNKACGNDHDIWQIENNEQYAAGSLNTCNTGNLDDQNHNSCTFSCDSAKREAAITSCDEKNTKESDTSESTSGNDDADQNEEPAAKNTTLLRKEVKCPDGTIKESIADCPKCARGLVYCGNSKCVKEQWECNPYTCPDGSKVSTKSKCPIQNPCPDGVVCPDGTCVNEKSACEVCCKTTGSSVSANIPSYKTSGPSDCRKQNGIAVESSYCTTGCAPDYVKCNDGTCKKTSTDCTAIKTPITIKTPIIAR